MKIGFIGLGNVGGKLAGSLLRNKFDLTIRDLDIKIVDKFQKKVRALHNLLKNLQNKLI